MRPVIVDSTQCHLWTDALHIRQLAHEALNKWDRGTYVRMTVVTVWIALESSCQDALAVRDIGYRFKENLDRALEEAALPAIDWSQGLWQQVRLLQELRKTNVHRFLALEDMFPRATVADQVIETVRCAIEDVYARAGKAKPTWLELNAARGWNSRSDFGHATMTALYGGAQSEDPRTVKIYIVVDGEEKLTTVLPAGSDPQGNIEQILAGVRIPISAIRVYENGELTQDLVVNMRGNG